MICLVYSILSLQRLSMYYSICKPRSARISGHAHLRSYIEVVRSCAKRAIPSNSLNFCGTACSCMVWRAALITNKLLCAHLMEYDFLVACIPEYQ
jgi:hypothetical protein